MRGKIYVDNFINANSIIQWRQYIQQALYATTALESNLDSSYSANVISVQFGGSWTFAVETSVSANNMITQICGSANGPGTYNGLFDHRSLLCEVKSTVTTTRRRSLLNQHTFIISFVTDDRLLAMNTVSQISETQWENLINQLTDVSNVNLNSVLSGVVIDLSFQVNSDNITATELGTLIENNISGFYENLGLILTNSGLSNGGSVVTNSMIQLYGDWELGTGALDSLYTAPILSIAQLIGNGNVIKLEFNVNTNLGNIGGFINFDCDLLVVNITRLGENPYCAWKSPKVKKEKKKKKIKIKIKIAICKSKKQSTLLSKKKKLKVQIDCNVRLFVCVYVCVVRCVCMDDMSAVMCEYYLVTQKKRKICKKKNICVCVLELYAYTDIINSVR